MFLGPVLDFLVSGRADGGAVDEQPAVSAHNKGAGAVKNIFHRFVIGDDSDDDVRVLCDVGEFLVISRADFVRERLGALSVNVVDGGDVEVLVLESAGHVGAHAADSDEANFF